VRPAATEMAQPRCVWVAGRFLVINMDTPPKAERIPEGRLSFRNVVARIPSRPTESLTKRDPELVIVFKFDLQHIDDLFSDANRFGPTYESCCHLNLLRTARLINCPSPSWCLPPTKRDPALKCAKT